MQMCIEVVTKVKELTLQQTNDWINAMEPEIGISVDFKGVRVLDGDLLGLLRYHKQEIENRRAARKKSLGFAID